MSNARPVLLAPTACPWVPGYISRFVQPFVGADRLITRHVAMRGLEGSALSFPVENQAQSLRLAFEKGSLPRDLYAKNLLRLLGLTNHPVAQKVAAAFIVGRLDARLLEKNLGALQGPPRE